MKRRPHVLLMFLLIWVSCIKDQGETSTNRQKTFTNDTPRQNLEKLLQTWTPAQPIPNLSLIDQRGKNFELNDFKDRFLLLSFIYTRCPIANACPLTLQNLRAVEKLWREAERKGETHDRQLHFLVVTLDPDYDTPERLNAFAQQHGLEPSTFTLATGDKVIVKEILPSLFNILALPGEGNTIQHNVKTILIQPGLIQAHIWKDNELVPSDVLDAILSRSSIKRDNVEHR